ncbi:hypothetical protein P154DRAFT_594713 [Amniculicola lignicola CBS 123094]|uniref:Uncharacterized protein n=1 Tax=Amniculicola lignicola CBS 123094 TaxID=1392246 RepID=A0A6A5WMU8_9PLEO|nr:hypothetical protein P154DRAFT_594713 [Amniculicola lignicola CBS 123094]
MTNFPPLAPARAAIDPQPNPSFLNNDIHQDEKQYVIKSVCGRASPTCAGFFHWLKTPWLLPLSKDDRAHVNRVIRPLARRNRCPMFEKYSALCLGRIGDNYNPGAAKLFVVFPYMHHNILTSNAELKEWHEEVMLPSFEVAAANRVNGRCRKQYFHLQIWVQSQMGQQSKALYNDQYDAARALCTEPGFEWIVAVSRAGRHPQFRGMQVVLSIGETKEIYNSANAATRAVQSMFDFRYVDAENLQYSLGHPSQSNHQRVANNEAEFSYKTSWSSDQTGGSRPQYGSIRSSACGENGSGGKRSSPVYTPFFEDAIDQRTSQLSIQEGDTTCESSNIEHPQSETFTSSTSNTDHESVMSLSCSSLASIPEDMPDDQHHNLQPQFPPSIHEKDHSPSAHQSPVRTSRQMASTILTGPVEIHLRERDLLTDEEHGRPALPRVQVPLPGKSRRAPSLEGIRRFRLPTLEEYAADSAMESAASRGSSVVCGNHA